MHVFKEKIERWRRFVSKGVILASAISNKEALLVSGDTLVLLVAIGRVG
jgi:hypothetical protein